MIQEIRRKGKRKTQDPCEACSMHRTRCLCHLVPTLNLRTRLTLVIHAKELNRATNTGTLAAKAIIGSHTIVRGMDRGGCDLSSLILPSHTNLFLYPSIDAIELNADYVSTHLDPNRPVHLIVPDGNWRQASKVHLRHKELSSVQRVIVCGRKAESRFLRQEHHPQGLATLQAIAYALGALESELACLQLLDLYREKLDRTLRGRGQLSAPEEKSATS